MNALKKNPILFSSMLSPLLISDWQAHVNFEIDRDGKSHGAQSSVSLVISEETILFDNHTRYGTLTGKAELLDVSVDEVSILLLVQERCHDGACRTIMSSVVHANLNMPTTVNLFNEQFDEFVSLKVEIFSV